MKKFRFIVILITLFCFSFEASAQKLPKGEWEPGEFREKLTEMYSRIEKSLKILRKQITENQSAPFLADLYVQLGELLVQKANVIYYIEKEKQQDISQTSAADKKFEAVVVAQKEAIQIFRKILKEFPEYKKKKKVLFLLTNALKSIGSIPLFLVFAQKLIQLYPDSQEAMKTDLLMGQHFFEREDYKEAIKHFVKVARTGPTYEKNLARYRIGLVYTKTEKWDQALKMFEMVAMDDELRPEDNPLEMSLSSKSAGTNLKREALIDSIKPYTIVHKKNPQPLAYYGRVAPTEVHFQEVVEKLAYRYIFLKKYNFAVELLRTLSERIMDPQRVINIYQEVLLQIPLKERINIPVYEIQFVLDKYNTWINFYKLPTSTRKLAHHFFEKQVRELGTRNHAFAKKIKNDPKKRMAHLIKAAEFLNLYVSYFNNGSNKVKMGINLGDIYYMMKDYLSSGDFYLRTFQGEFGPPQKKSLLIRNAIHSLTQKREYDFYELLRVKGLLINSIRTYMKLDPKQARAAKLNFLLVKTIYEQDQQGKSVEALFQFMKKFSKSSYAVKAGEIILDYYNTRSDFSELVRWSQRILNLKLPHTKFNKKVANIKEVSLRKRLTQAIESVAEFDAFSEGKSYYKVAVASGNRALMDLALKEALGKSKREGDYNTFFEAATTMAEQAGGTKKKADLVSSLVGENVRIGRFYTAIKSLEGIINDNGVNNKYKENSFKDAVNLAISLRDWDMLIRYMKNPLWGGVPKFTRDKVKQQMADLLESPVRIPNEVAEAVLEGSPTADVMLGLFKAQHRLGGGVQERISKRINQMCGGSSPLTVCKWSRLKIADGVSNRFIKTAVSAPPQLEAVEKISTQLFAITGAYKKLEGSGDPQLDMLLTLRNSQVYAAFSKFLSRVAKANADFSQVIQPKAKEAAVTAVQYRKTCRQILKKVKIATPMNAYCAKGKNPTIQQALSWKSLKSTSAPSGDPMGAEIKRLRRGIFVSDKSPDKLVELAELYLSQGHINHAAAMSIYGAEVFKPEAPRFNAVLGCAVMKMGLYNEAAYHLKSARGNLKSGCLSQLKSSMRGI